MPGDGRDETLVERADRNWGDILQELRAVQTGTQIITGFLLAVAFQPVFQELEAYEVGLYLVLVVLAGCATVLGLAPIIMHRQVFGRQRKAELVRAANRMLVALLVVVSFLAAGVVSLVFDVAVSRTAGFVALGTSILVLLVFWTVVPRLGRRRSRTGV
ncbi:sodium:proton antiporter [Agromyces sp. MMS17-SY077]|uniref:Sodium:proton antiporter n=1 Tax=Agromyces seonyuensis TaxID=2662446 RepID=A0A6I4P180_9MICO|nr:sodium:proton antiporter [Agromyces seonyuensis]